jgi:hypothetical protein
MKLCHGPFGEKGRSSREAPPANGLLWTDGADWCEGTIPARPWVAPGYLMRGAVTVLSGAGGVSKSTLMVAYAVSLAFGEPFQGFRPLKPARVMLFNVEDDQEEQRRRFSGALRATGRAPADLRGRVIRCGPKMVGSLFNIDAKTKGVSGTPLMEELVTQIEGFRPDVLILDPFVELHPADENDNSAVRSIMAALRAMAAHYDLAMVILHHTRKGSTQAGDPDAVRGASSIIGAARIVLTVNPMSSDEAAGSGVSETARRHYFRVDGAKSNYAPLTTAEWFQRITAMLDNGDTVATLEPWAPPVDVVSPEVFEAIKAAIAAGSSEGPWSPKLSKDNRSVKALLTHHGVLTVSGQKQILQSLLSDKVEIASFIHKRRPAKGLRTVAGEPHKFEWLDDNEFPDGGADE